jgi:hypothetical protein
LQPKNKNQKITVVTFGRAGEDNKSFRLANIETTIAGFAGADYDLCVVSFYFYIICVNIFKIREYDLCALESLHSL